MLLVPRLSLFDRVYFVIVENKDGLEEIMKILNEEEQRP